MGFFKDAKDGIKGAKDLGDYHGGMPSMRGAFKDLAALSSDQGQGQILKKGVPTKARVLSFAMPHPTEKFTMQVDLEITPPEGGDPYQVTYLYPTARQKEALSMGMEVPVKVMPDDPTAVAVQWDALKGSVAAQGGAMNAAMAGLSNTYAGTADAAGRAALAARASAPAPAAAEDPADRIKKAQQLLDGGLINAEEFEAKKAEILKDV
jgi:hypothetical protein